MQQVIVILIVAACGAWLTLQAYRFMRPKAGGKTCGGGCCDGKDSQKPAKTPEDPGGTERVMMISSDDLRARLKARKA